MLKSEHEEILRALATAYSLGNNPRVSFILECIHQWDRAHVGEYSPKEIKDNVKFKEAVLIGAVRGNLLC